MAGREEIVLPDVWGEGVLFAFSGIDGETDLRRELVATTLEDRPGFRIRFPHEAEFHPHISIDGRPNEGFPQNTGIALVCGDAIDLTITVSDQEKIRLRYAAVDNTAIAGKMSCSALRRRLSVELRFSAEEKGEIQYGFLGGGGSVRREYHAPFEVEFFISNGGPPQFDFEEIFQKRLDFFGTPALRPGIDPKIARTLAKCFSVLKVNVHSAQGDLKRRWSTPDRYPHRRAWLWDTVFQAMGLKYISRGLAEDTIRAVLLKERPDGFIPHMMTPEDENDTDITQPPLLCWIAWRLFDFGSTVQFAELVFPKLVKYVRRLLAMDRNGNGLLEWSQGGYESGMDNSPRFDLTEQADAVDLNSFVANELFFLGKIAAKLDESDMAEYCRAKREALSKRINRLLWDEDDGMYYDLGPDGIHVKVKTIAGFTPLFAGVVPDTRAERLRAHLMSPAEFNRPFPVSTVAADEPTFSDDMWRGPTWVNYNYLVIEGLRRYGLNEEAGHIEKRTVEEISRWYHDEGVIFEYFDSECRTSPRNLRRKGDIGGHWLHTCVKDYGWTAAVFAELVLGR